MPKKLQLSDFLVKYRNKHNGNYIILEETYTKAGNSVSAVCQVHGVFSFRASDYKGCPICANIEAGKKRRKKYQDFLTNKITIDSGYSFPFIEEEYTTRGKKITALCSKHGYFHISPTNILRGRGCPKCNKSYHLPDEEFTHKILSQLPATISPINIYYPGRRGKITLSCLKHGVFKRRWDEASKGCPICNINTSKPEDYFEKEIKKNFQIVQRNYNKDSRYPFRCDFYVPERDLFIELNLHWTHGYEWYDKRKKTTKNLIDSWSSKNSSYYENAINVFSLKDVAKRKMAKVNNLNYVVLWNEQDIKDWFALGCPDGHDGDGMYTWKK